MQNDPPASNEEVCIVCPHCEQRLSESEIRSILGQFGRSKRRSMVAGRFRDMTPEQRSAEARRISQVRWAKRKSAGE